MSFHFQSYNSSIQTRLGVQAAGHFGAFQSYNSSIQTEILRVRGSLNANFQSYNSSIQTDETVDVHTVAGLLSIL